MTDQTNAPGAGSEPAPVVAPANLDSDSYTPEQAFEAYQKRISPAESAPEATAEPESAKADAAPETAPSEEPEAAQPTEELSPLEPPRSWTKDRKEQFNALPRDLQEYVTDRAQEQEREFRRSQNEAAEKLKAVEAERSQLEQKRKDYESKLPLLEKKLQTVGPFADIQNMEDLRNLQKNDPFRFQEYQLYTWEQQAEQTELREVEARKSAEEQSNWAKHVHEENARFAEYVPEFTDKAKAQELTAKAVEQLHELGFKDEELNELAAGKQKLSIYDHRIQRLLFSTIKFNEMKAAPLKAIPKPVPAVQKPGVARAPGAASADAIQASRNKLNSTGSAEDAYALYQAKKARAR